MVPEFPLGESDSAQLSDDAPPIAEFTVHIQRGLMQAERGAIIALYVSECSGVTRRFCPCGTPARFGAPESNDRLEPRPPFRHMILPIPEYVESDAETLRPLGVIAGNQAV
jgi:hypothetical protein